MLVDEDSPPRRFGHVDVVVAHRYVAHHSQAGRRFHELGVDAVGEQREEAVCGGRLAQQDVAGRRQLLGPDANAGGPSQSLDGVAGELTGDVDGGLAGHHFLIRG